MVRLWVSLLAVAVVWIFGTWPWIIINNFLCSQDPPMVCPEPAEFWRKVGLVLTMDAVLIGLAAVALQRLRQLTRARR